MQRPQCSTRSHSMRSWQALRLLAQIRAAASPQQPRQVQARSMCCPHPSRLLLQATPICLGKQNQAMACCSLQHPRLHPPGHYVTPTSTAAAVAATPRAAQAASVARALPAAVVAMAMQPSSCQPHPHSLTKMARAASLAVLSVTGTSAATPTSAAVDKAVSASSAVAAAAVLLLWRALPPRTMMPVRCSAC